jgi:urease subunit beta
MSNERAPQDPSAAPSMDENPFDNPALSPPTEPEDAAHPTDDPGREYADDEAEGHSGVGAPSEPRRSGTSSRQAPRRTTDDAMDPRLPVIPSRSAPTTISPRRTPRWTSTARPLAASG